MTASETAKGQKGKKASFPSSVSPMLCTLVREPFAGAGYIHEIKWDGYRIIGFKQKNKVRLASRSGLNYTDKYPPIEAALKKIKSDFVVDGEIVVHNKSGKPDFDALQANEAGAELYYYVFDLLWLDGYNLKDLALTERKAILKKLVAGNAQLQYSEHFDDGPALFAKMQNEGIEGIVSKQAESPYAEGERGRAWLKTPTEIRQEFVIGGWIESDKNPYFRTLLFGAYKDDKLEWIGHSGSGYKNKDMPAIHKKLKAIETKKSPFTNEINSTGVVHWVKPKLVANFKFATWTKSGRIRKPATFLGWRADKKATDVVREVPKAVSTTSAAPEKKPLKKLPASADSNWKKLEAMPKGDTAELNIEGCEIALTDVDREIWKGVTKADLIQYYHSIADYILPHLADRPLSLHIKPVNAGAPGFYIKDMEKRQPECAEIFTTPRKHHKAGKRNTIDYLVCNNLSTLLYLINLGCIDINPWTSTAAHPQEPDFIVIDLDPSDDDFAKAVQCAMAAKKVFDELKLKSFLKTSGKTGIHIVLPCSGFGFPEARDIAEKICAQIHTLVPAISTTEVTISERGDRLYLDPNQNDEADTIASAYSARPYHTPTVSTPLDWKEVKAGLRAADFTIHNIAARLKIKGDLWAGVYDKKSRSANNKILNKILNDA